MPKYSTESFIQQAKLVHNDKFDYTKTIYKKSSEKVRISCPNHGEFIQLPSSHLKGYGCKKCALELTAEKKKNKRVIRKCQHCGKEFSRTPSEDKKTKNHFCSRLCYLNHIEVAPQVCDSCGNSFVPKNRNSRFCSIKCTSDYNRHSREQFIQESIKVHGNRYDYSLVKYQGMNVNVTILCPEHGVFEQKPSQHKMGVRCKYCAIKEVAEANTKPVENTCENCGCSFYRTKSKSKIQKFCSAQCSQESNGLSLEEFIQKAEKKHHGFYDYSKSTIDIKGSRITQKIDILCPIHGKFKQTIKAHLNGADCPYCSGRLVDKDTFLKKSKEIHKYKYDYSAVQNIKDSSERVSLICPKHGEFNLVAQRHMRGDGCRKCAIELRGELNFKKASKKWIPQAKEVHDNLYDYSRVKYISAHSEVEIICAKHGNFWQKANNHLNGSGCPKCSSRGFDRDKSGYLYYLRISTHTGYLWKIGITNNSVERRFPRDISKIKTIKTWFYRSGEDAYQEEQRILRKYKDYKYKGKSILEDSGNTELFIKDVLMLDKYSG